MVWIFNLMFMPKRECVNCKLGQSLYGIFKRLMFKLESLMPRMDLHLNMMALDQGIKAEYLYSNSKFLNTKHLIFLNVYII